MEYTDEHIEELISCSKRITRPPAREMKEDRGHWKNSFEMESEDGNYKFIAFIRYNSAFHETFPLVWIIIHVQKREPFHSLDATVPTGEPDNGIIMTNHISIHPKPKWLIRG